MDATHLAEFHQIEGLIADTNLTLGDLMGVLHQFFSRMGEYIDQQLLHLFTHMHVHAA